MSSALYPPSAALVDQTRAGAEIRGIDPLADQRWEPFVNAHPRASLFHSRAWLQALSRTYGYRPIAYTTSGGGEPLRNALVFCVVDSWLTGRRLVSLPFSDHCDPLGYAGTDLQILGDAIAASGFQGWRYLEVRPLIQLAGNWPGFQSSASYHFHKLCLEPGLQVLFRAFHKDCIQRKILRAERERLGYEEGASPALLDSFYHLFTLTRRRHRLPPQPRAWFQSLVECFGSDVKIRIARKGDCAVAAMLTIRHKNTLTYKYGCSDARFNRFGGIQLLYWNSIQEAKESGLQTFDLGRTDFDQGGLVTFKDRWGTARSRLTYFRYAPYGNPTHIFDLSAKNWKTQLAGQLLQYSHPDVLSLIGTLLYRHVG